MKSTCHYHKAMTMSLLVVAMVWTTLQSLAATAIVDNIQWTYTVSNGKASLGGGSSSSTAVPKSTQGAITIPSSFGAYPVTSIGNSAFSGCRGLAGVTIPDGVMNIGNYAFSDCSGLAGVTIPDGVMNIGNYAFSGCSGLTGVTMPNSVTSIGNSAFSGCSGLAGVTIPDGVMNIGNYAFSGCSGLTGVTIPDGVTSIGGSAFSGCSGLASVTIPNSVTNIGNSAFSGCSGLTSVTISDSVTNIGVLAFSGCSGLASVTIPNSVTDIGDYAFYGCSGLMSVTIPNSVTDIGDYAFYGCSGLMSVTIPQIVCNMRLSTVFPSAFQTISNVHISDSVTNIGNSAFSGCSGLTSVTISDSVTNIGERAFFYCSGLTSVTIPDSVTSIGDSAFSGCSGLASVTIPDSVTSIGDSAFSGCSGLASVTIPDSVTDIGDHAFFGCRGLASVTIPDGVTDIGDHAFCGCSGLASVTIPDSVTNIGHFAFSGCSGLTGVTIPDGVTDIGDHAFYGCSGLASVTIPSVTSIGNYAFYGCSGLTSVTIPSVTSIGDYAFYGCSGLTSVTIPSVTSIGDYVFDGCGGLASVTIPQIVCNMGLSTVFPSAYQTITNVHISDNVTDIARYAFEGCTNLQTEVWCGYRVLDGWLIGYTDEAGETIPNADKLKGICSEALKGCTALRRLEFGDNSRLVSIGAETLKGCTELKTLVLPPSLTRIGHEAFMGCSYLDNVIVPGGVVSIGDRAFKNCTGFTWAQIEHGVEYIGDEAFYGCWRITEVDIPSSVESIGVNAFGGDSSIAKVALRGDVRKLSEIFSSYAQITEATVKQGCWEIVDGLFSGCSRLKRVFFLGNCPELENEGRNLYEGTPYDYWGYYDYYDPYDWESSSALVTYVDKDSTGWDGTPGSHTLPMMWPLVGDNRRAIMYTSDISAPHTVNFDANGGSPAMQSAAQRSEEPFALPAEPTRADYEFMGWWTEKNGGVKVTEETIFLNGVYDTLYAHWEYVALGVKVEDAVETGSDGTLEMTININSISNPKVTVRGLPAGLKYDAATMTISGRATKPGVYAVTVSATNATVKQPVTATFEIVVPNFVSEKLPNLRPERDAYGIISCGVAFAPELVDCSPAEDGWTVKATGLPSGLKYDSKTGRIVGVPTKAGTFTVTFTASKKGEANQVATITMNVETLPTWATGTFTGYVAGMRDAVACLNGQDARSPSYGFATMTVAANGKISGKIALDGTNWTFSATSYAAVEYPPWDFTTTNFIVEATAKAGKATMPMILEVSGHAGRVTLPGGGAGGGGRGATALPNAVAGGTFGEDEVKMWRGVWKDKETASEAKATIAEFEGVYTVSMEAHGGHAAGDDGHAGRVTLPGGYLSLTVGKDGNVKVTGKLADGTSVSATSPLMFDEEAGWFVFLYTAPSAYKGGAFAAAIGFGYDDNAGARPARPYLAPVMFAPQWTSRNPQATGEHGVGFERALDFSGAYYNKLDTLKQYYDAMRFDLDDAPELGYSFKRTYIGDNGRKTSETTARAASAVDAFAQDGMTVSVDANGKLIVAKATKPVQNKETKEWIYSGANDGGLTLSFTQATGVFKGSYTFWYDYVSASDETTGKDTYTHASKKVNFEGIMVQGMESMAGFYLWDATGTYVDSKTGKKKTYKYKESHAVSFLAQ